MKTVFTVVVAFISLAFSQPIPKASMDRGKTLYTTYCLTCHQADGQGVQRMYPTLTNKTYVGGDKKKLIGIVLNGLQGEIEVEGDTYNNVMASHDFLTDQQIADLLTYVRNSFSNKYSAVTVAEVKAARAANKK
jgi:mono/diheme cytochrome c family protein